MWDLLKITIIGLAPRTNVDNSWSNTNISIEKCLWQSGGHAIWLKCKGSAVFKVLFFLRL